MDLAKTSERISELRRETARISHEPGWYPLLRAAVFVAVTLSLTYALIR